MLKHGSLLGRQRPTRSPLSANVRSFSSFNKFLNYLPRRSITYTLVGLNASLFLVHALILQQNVRGRWKFFDHFSLSRKNFMSGRFHTLFTAHLTDYNPWDVLLNGILTFYFGREVERMYGPRFLLRLCGFACIVGSLALCVKILNTPFETSYMGTYVTTRAIMYTMIIKNPYVDAIFFRGAPRIPFFILGAVSLFVDIIRRDPACLSGFGAAFLFHLLI